MVHIKQKEKITLASEYSRLERILLHNFEEQIATKIFRMSQQ